jgi:hypothetical protein
MIWNAKVMMARDRNKLIHSVKMTKGLEGIKAVVTTWHTSHTKIVHWPENSVSTDHGTPEVDFTQGVVHEASVHLREPVINTGKHTEEGSYSHHNVEVSYYKVSIVHLDIMAELPRKIPVKPPEMNIDTNQ